MGALVVWLIVGALAGWIAGFVVKGAGFGLIGNIVVGILGSIVAGYLFPILGIHIGSGLIGSIIHAAIGAIILLFVSDPESLNGARAQAVQCGGIGIKTGGTPGKLERRLIAASSEPCGFR
jgi:uncharacterized membrane protein YeaQ/YmgE (transglycosylase-associated protein family)